MDIIEQSVIPWIIPEICEKNIKVKRSITGFNIISMFIWM